MSEEGKASAPAGKVDEKDLTPEELELKRAREAKKKAAAERKAKAKAKAIAAKKAKEVGNDGAKEQSKRAKAKAAKKVHVKTAYVNTTPAGEKKDVSGEFPKEYDPSYVEAAWYEWWEAQGFFKPSDETDRGKFVMVIPPPNVTGALHLGHALTNAVQDAVTRWHRMNGRTALWVPGTDHAGIATQVRVEKKLMNEQGKTRHDLGREDFVKMVWQWKDEYGGTIQRQLRRCGSSYDWSREVFTLDDKLSVAVTEAFCRWFEAGKIYRASRLVNWCCALNTAISDVEVDHVEFDTPGKRKVPGYDKLIEFGVLHSFAYKVVGEEDKEIVVATTRIETMLGDTAVAVHPEDPRYKDFHGKFLQHPFVDRQIPIVLDAELVDMEFGTGAVKITPAHDPNDYECGVRRNLPSINILNIDGTINSQGGEFEGMKRFDARYAVIAKLKEKGLFRGKTPNKMVIGVCSRSGDIIEPLVQPQWFVSCKEMGKKACDAVRSGDLEIIPKIHEKTWFNWLEEVHDWCISRQLWWGHRIPAYLVQLKGEPVPDNTTSESFVCGRTLEEAMARAVEKTGASAEDITLHQDPDVLDTWFSSGLFPFSVFGWPNEESEDFKRFYPTSLLETGHDIIFFWVARMVMMGQDLTGKLPFKQVYLHAMVRDAQGRKMSKSKGNVIDPIWVIEGKSLEELHASLEGGVLDAKEIEIAKKGQKQNFPKGIGECGTDAMRFALCSYTEQGRSINLDINRVIAYRHFCNKMWNATKFVLMSIGDDYVPEPYSALSAPDLPAVRSSIEKWIFSRMSKCIEAANESMNGYLFGQATSACHGFFLNELCGVLIEISKPYLSSGEEETKNMFKHTLYTCLEVGLRLLHPFMPFVTEELWQRLPRRPAHHALDETRASIMVCPYPAHVEEWKNEGVEAEIADVLSIAQQIRAMKVQYNLGPRQALPALIRCSSEDLQEVVARNAIGIATLSFCAEVNATVELEVPAGYAVEILSDRFTVMLNLAGQLDVPKEVEKLEKKLEQLQKNLEKLEKRMASDNFAKVSDAAKEKTVEQRDQLSQEIVTVKGTIETLSKLA